MGLKFKVCTICNKPFMPKTGVQKICLSEACVKIQRQGIEQRRAEKRKNNPVYQVTLTEKRCYTCKDILPRKAFGLNRNDPTGLQGSCKKCRSEYSQRPDQQDKDRNRKRRWHLANRVRMAILNKRRYEATKAQRSKANREKYAQDPNRHREKRAQTYQERKTWVRRVCPCGRGYYVKPGTQDYHKKWFHSIACKNEIQLRVCAGMIEAARSIGTRLVA